ncbi:type IV pilin N-terminal domain-containing protein [Halomicroarcula sp. GCM10025709]|uniref:type IV pilin N-terminal domain-containing protein n=1 Tax=Haloarcula TaxID=2237 RepID=UPI0024C2FCE9|nr:type IV pilin N-terminal domain-containing protein [Halomicroarcula sp. YJ-61-S]
MQLKELFNDDDAVSPVIGVILMVAITVILAAVIASFVLGLGDQTQSATPQASFSFEYDESGISGTSGEGVLSVTHDGGDTIPADELYIRGSDYTTVSSPPSGTMSSNGQFAGNVSVSEVSAGNGVEVAVQNSYEIRVVYESAEGDSSATLGQDSGPEA